MSWATALRMIKRRARQAWLPGEICAHSFRGTGITEYLRNGRDLEVAARIAGHESMRTTQFYMTRSIIHCSGYSKIEALENVLKNRNKIRISNPNLPGSEAGSPSADPTRADAPPPSARARSPDSLHSTPAAAKGPEPGLSPTEPPAPAQPAQPGHAARNSPGCPIRSLQRPQCRKAAGDLRLAPGIVKPEIPTQSF